MRLPVFLFSLVLANSLSLIADEDQATATAAAGCPTLSYVKPATPQAALAELQAGNNRFICAARFRSTLACRDAEVRANLAGSQDPFAVIVTCADSRLDETMIFDQEPGRLFVVREAGNSPDLQSVATIDYGIGHLAAKTVIVMGHRSCGAVGAVADAKGTPLPGNLYVFQESMAGLLESTPQKVGESTVDYKNRLASVNAYRQAKALFDKSPEITHLAETGAITVIPAYYDLTTGKVKFSSAVHPH